MKRIFFALISLLLISATSFSQNQWQWLNPKPSGFACLKIAFVDNQTGYILNSNGDLIKTVDQGINWNIVKHFPNVTCMGFADSTGIIAGNAGTMYLSTDNGNSWTAVNSGITDQFQFVNIVSRDSFFISTATGNIYATGDRGKTWATLNCNTTLSSITFVNSKIGYAGSTASSIFKTVDGGQTWSVSNQVNYSPSSVFSIQFINADTGFAFRQWDSLLVTYDGGNTWQGYGTYETMYTIDFVNSKVGYLGGSNGALYRTTDGGATATSISPPGTFKYAYDISSIDFISADTGFVVGFLGRIMKTVDGGNTWALYSPTYDGISSISFGSSSTGYASNGNYLYKTSDTGRTWNTTNLSTGTNFGDQSTFKYSHFTSSDTGYVISDQYVNAHLTNDGGQTWKTVNPGIYSYQYFDGISYLDPQNCILSLGTLLTQSKDGGNTWNPVWTAQYSDQFFGKVFYLDQTNAFAIKNGQLYKTTDGFQTSVNVFSSSLNYDVADVWFINPQKGFLVDVEAEIFVTNDGGNTWQSVPFADNFLYSTGAATIRFFNEQVGYISTGTTFGGGLYGRTYKTTDGGRTWQKSYDIGGSIITFTPDSSVVVAGFGGTILKSSVKGWQLDSFTIKTNNSCGEILSASIGVALGEVDSIQFVITKPDGSTIATKSSAVSVNNDRISFSSTVSDLIANSTYSARVKFFYNGSYNFSDTLQFVAQSLPAPYVYDSSGVLVSSATSGNQWYLNGAPVSGATQQRFAPKISGYYTAQAVQDSCVSPMSNPVQFISNNLGVIVYPNPSKDYISFLNTQNRTVQIRISDINGKTILTSTLGYYNAPINIKALSDGEYIVTVRDQKSGETANILFVKL